MSALSKSFWILFTVIFLVSTFVNPAICVIMLGSSFIYLAIRGFLVQRKIEQNGISCIGKIVDIKKDDEGFLTPIVKFTTLDGIEVLGEPWISVSSHINGIVLNKITVEKDIMILYSPDDPEKYIISNQVGRNNASAIFFLIIGLGLTIVGICTLLGFQTILSKS